MNRDNWPMRPDGTRKTMGELSPEQQKAILREVCAKLKAELESPPAQAFFRAFLNDKPQA